MADRVDHAGSLDRLIAAAEEIIRSATPTHHLDNLHAALSDVRKARGEAVAYLHPHCARTGPMAGTCVRCWGEIPGESAIPIYAAPPDTVPREVVERLAAAGRNLIGNAGPEQMAEWRAALKEAGVGG